MTSKDVTSVFPLKIAVPVAASAGVEESVLSLIYRLRNLWRHTQLAGREDFDRACFLISGDETTTIERYAVAFFQGTQLFALRRLKFFNAKSEAVSDDEMWLARLLVAIYSEDYTSARYLMALRISPPGQRRLMFLAQGLAHRLCAETISPSGETQTPLTGPGR